MCKFLIFASMTNRQTFTPMLVKYFFVKNMLNRLFKKFTKVSRGKEGLDCRRKKAVYQIALSEFAKKNLCLHKLSKLIRCNYQSKK